MPETDVPKSVDSASKGGDSDNPGVDVKISREQVEKKSNVEMEIYNQDEAATYFYRVIRKSVAFVKVPVVLKSYIGTADFGSSCQINIPKIGDYLMNLTLYFELPAVQLDRTKFPAADIASSSKIRIHWANKLAHQIVKDVKICIGDCDVIKLDTTFLDIWSEFMMDAGKYDGYSAMIGDTDDLKSNNVNRLELPATQLCLPLPTFFSRDSGLALPVSNLSDSDISVEFNFRKWNEVLNIANATTSTNEEPKSNQLLAIPKLNNVRLVATYAVCTKYEMNRTRCENRRMLIERPMKMTETEMLPSLLKSDSPNVMHMGKVDGAIRAVFFVVKNTTERAMNSFYAVGVPVITSAGSQPSSAPLSEIGIKLGNDVHVPRLPALYYSHQQPMCSAMRIPRVPGYYMYSFALHLCDVDPMGSLNPAVHRKRLQFEVVPSASMMGATREKYTFIAIALCNRIAVLNRGSFKLTRTGSGFEEEIE